ncbi:NAD(P)H-hydrate epimerase [Agromyces archimandritae]|uniref:NAD(P)H-hydrate epimerase n=1 Tax=Agromyces archimandritae TaxID=2781962 RepID=A0A975FMM8_9MICO|nr:NAD(P)H-hydrate epimerase [Agromyces archimandritae]QTX04930.1 NAD(P)H-hydrate epimerase [Agromyces archimandritae]
MVAGYTAAQVRAAEAPHLERGEPLMAMAAAALAEAVREELVGQTGGVVLLVGSGDNGGDALFAGAELAAEGVPVVIVPTASTMHETGRRAALEAGASERAWHPDPDGVRAAVLAAAVVVDGILGTGASGALRGTAKEIVAGIRPLLEAGARPRVVACDLPSGIDPDDGRVDAPEVLRADTTVTFGAAKAGLLIEPGSDYVGRLRVVDLGLAPELAVYTPAVERG